MSKLPPFNPLAPAHCRDPYPAYRHYRLVDPVHCATGNSAAENNSWYLFRHADNMALLRDSRAGVDSATPTKSPEFAPELPVMDMRSPYEIMATNMMLLRDPPDHTRLRTLVGKAFTPRTIANLDTRIHSVTDYLLDQVADQGKMDMIADLAFPLPMIIIAELLGIPSTDRDLMRTWSVTFSTALDRVREEDAERVFTAANISAMEFTSYFEDLINERRRAPEEDLISGLLAAHDAGDRLDTEELVSMSFLLLAAGHETTVNLIGNGTLALLQNQDQLDLLIQQPELMASAVDEFLRYDAPVQLTDRTIFEDIKLNGVLIRKGDWVTCLLGAANRDPAVFAEPDRLDVQRANGNNHLAFSSGIHYCLGAPLAKLEGKIAFGRLLERMPDLELAVPAADLTWRDGVVFHGVDALPVKF